MGVDEVEGLDGGGGAVVGGEGEVDDGAGGEVGGDPVDGGGEGGGEVEGCGGGFEEGGEPFFWAKVRCLLMDGSRGKRAAHLVGSRHRTFRLLRRAGRLGGRRPS